MEALLGHGEIGVALFAMGIFAIQVIKLVIQTKQHKNGSNGVAVKAAETASDAATSAAHALESFSLRLSDAMERTRDDHRDMTDTLKTLVRVTEGQHMSIKTACERIESVDRHTRDCGLLRERT